MRLLLSVLAFLFLSAGGAPQLALGADAGGPPKKAPPPAAGSVFSKIRTSFALQGSSIRYLEPNNQIALSEVGLTGKVTATYPISRLFGIGANGFMTLLPFTLSPSGLAPARFWGVNGRVSVALPHPDFVRLGAALGYYIMGMITSDAYGVSMANGPQLFLTANSPPGTQREWFGYVKYAALGGSSLELATGGGYQLAAVGGKPLFAVLDLSVAEFTGAGGLTSFYWTSVSLGAQIRI